MGLVAEEANDRLTTEGHRRNRLDLNIPRSHENRAHEKAAAPAWMYHFLMPKRLQERQRERATAQRKQAKEMVGTARQMMKGAGYTRKKLKKQRAKCTAS